MSERCHSSTTCEVELREAEGRQHKRRGVRAPSETARQPAGPPGMPGRGSLVLAVSRHIRSLSIPELEKREVVGRVPGRNATNHRECYNTRTPTRATESSRFRVDALDP